MRIYNNKLRPVGSQPGVLYGLAKVHKKVINGCPAFRPILSAIETPTYNIAKFLVPILKDLTSNTVLKTRLILLQRYCNTAILKFF